MNDEEKLALIEKKDKMLKNLDSAWTISEKGKIAVSAAMAMLSTKHGFYANIPIICKEDNCPYAATCNLLKNGLAPFGEPCPVEIAKIVKKYEDYVQELNVREEDKIDQTLLRDLINYEIIIDRCDAKIAQEANFVSLVPFAVGQDGTVLEKEEINKSIELRERMSKKKNEILQLLNSTRKDKAEQKININITPTEIYKEMLEKSKEFDKIIEADYTIEE